jgi:hypothetical protein
MQRISGTEKSSASGMRLRWKARRKLAMFSAMGLMLSAMSAQSQQLLDYAPFAGYALRKGILGNDYSQPLSSCITGTERQLPASSTTLQASITYNADEYKRAFHLDSSAQVTSLMGNAGGEARFGQETGSSGSAFDIVLEAYSEHPALTVDNVQWSTPYKEMIESGDAAKIQQVRQSCGDRFILTVFNEVRLFAVLRVSAQKLSALSTFAGKVNGSLKLDVNTITALLGGDRNISSANQSGAIIIEIFSQGVGGVVPTSAVLGITSSDGLTAIADKLAKSLPTLQATGQPVKYQLTPLPLMALEDLNDVRMIRALTELKSAYEAGLARLSNVRALLPPNADPRRLVLRQPQADAALANIQASLATYRDKVAEADSLCRKTNKYKECSAAYNALPQAPATVPVELPPLVPPLASTLFIAVNGSPLPLAHYSLLLSNAKSRTLFEAAKSLNAAAVNVDILAYVPSAYMSHIEVLSTLVEQVPPHRHFPVAAGRLRPEHIVLPDYFPADAGFGMIVVHADADRPCPVSDVNGAAWASEECFAEAGNLLLAALLSNVANNVIATGSRTPQNYILPLLISLQDCFTTPQMSQIGSMGIIVTRSGADVVAQFSLSLPLLEGQGALTLAMSSEKYDLKKWEQLRQDRISALVNFGAGTSAGPGACSPRIP